MSRSLRILFRDWLNRPTDEKAKAGRGLAEVVGQGVIARARRRLRAWLNRASAGGLVPARGPEVEYGKGTLPSAIIVSACGITIDCEGVEGDALVLPLDRDRELVLRRSPKGALSHFIAGEVQTSRSAMPRPPIEVRGILWSLQAAREVLASPALSGRAQSPERAESPAPAAPSGCRREA